MNTAIRDLFEKGRQYTYGTNEIIIRPGEEPRGIYLVKKGFIKMYTLSKHGEELQHTILSDSDLFPLLWAIGYPHREVYYQAMSNIEVVSVSAQDFRDAYESDKRVSKALISKLAQMLSDNDVRIDNLELHSVGERLAYRLLSLNNLFGVDHCKGRRIDAPIRHHDIADSLALTRETISREMAKLEKQGIVEYQKRELIINDIAKLTDIIEMPY